MIRFRLKNIPTIPPDLTGSGVGWTVRVDNLVDDRKGGYGEVLQEDPNSQESYYHG